MLKAVQSNLEDKRIAGRRVVLLTDGQRNDWAHGRFAGLGTLECGSRLNRPFRRPCR